MLNRVAAIVGLGVIAAAIIVLSGVIPLKASSGHWRPTALFLDFVKRRSVATHSIGIDVPPLDGRALRIAGAAHYETGCRPCHGSPGTPLPPIPARMTPHPPALKSRVSRWEPAELFSIAKHGIKFTGMPAWPAAGRDDEVWAVVAFIRELPHLDASEYSRLVFGDGEAPAAEWFVATDCVRCHGEDGQGRDDAEFPRLAGQKIEYLTRALDAYARGARHSGMMSPVAAALTPDDRRQLAAYFAALGPMKAAPATPRAVRGAEIAMKGVPSRDVPACSECHGPNPMERNPAYPRLAGQRSAYLVRQLELFAADRRGGSSFAHLMRDVATRLTDDDRRDAAAFYSALEEP